MPAFRPADRSAYNQQNKEGVPCGHSLFCSLWRSSVLGKGAPVRGPPAGGPRPTRPCGLRAAHPAHPVRRLCRRPPGQPLRVCPGNVAAKAGQARPGQVGRQPLRGATQSGRKAKPLRGRFAGLAPRQPRAGCGAGAPARPGPHSVGAVGPSAPPARSAALRPALPAWPRLRRRPGRAALPPHSPPGVAARCPSLGVPPPSRAGAPAAGCCCSPCPCGGPHLRTPRALAAQAPPSSRIRARRGAGNAACGRECRPLHRPARPRQAPRRAADAAHKRGPCLPMPRPARANRGGCPALCGPPAPSHSEKTVVLLCLLLRSASPAVLCRSGWCPLPVRLCPSGFPSPGQIGPCGSLRQTRRGPLVSLWLALLAVHRRSVPLAGWSFKCKKHPTG
mgnify:CR=1 FL=1